MFLTIHLSQDHSKISPYNSNTLLDGIEETLKNGEKVLLYLNKRGSHSSMICEDCEYLFGCPNCDISLSVHTNPKEHFLCHLCHRAYNIPDCCPKCGGVSLKKIWVGTQQIEEILKKYFEGKSISIFRFDSDSMKNKSSKKQALENIESSDIIIGTKMLTTGFDFEKIGLIGIILVESELSYPSYDAEERAYRSLRQLIGRGNRKQQKTQIFLQTFIPKNPLILRLTKENYKDFFLETLSERKDFLYPPYTEMVTLEYRDENSEKSQKFISEIQQLLQSFPESKDLHFLKSSVAFRKNNTFHSSLIIKGKNIRDILTCIEKTLFQNSKLSIIFES